MEAEKLIQELAKYNARELAQLLAEASNRRTPPPPPPKPQPSFLEVHGPVVRMQNGKFLAESGWVLEGNPRGSGYASPPPHEPRNCYRICRLWHELRCAEAERELERFKQFLKERNRDLTKEDLDKSAEFREELSTRESAFHVFLKDERAEEARQNKLKERDAEIEQNNRAYSSKLAKKIDSL